MRLHGLFEEQARQRPEAPAIEAGPVRLSYAELNRRSRIIAGRLAGKGVRPGTVVAVLMDRSVEAVVAILGVLKAGGAYLPIEPDQPQARLDFMLKDTAAAVLITRRGLGDRLPGFSGTVVWIDQEEGTATGLDTAQPGRVPGPEDPAYIIYTSGSTGQPKGVLIPHRAIVNFIQWMLDRFPTGADDAVLLKSALGFDASVWEMFVALSSGARLVLADPGTHADAGAIARQIIEHRVTNALFVPSLLEPFISHSLSPQCTSLRRLFSGGEVLVPGLARRVQAALPVELVNLYGPTETAIAATFWVCGRPDGEQRIPIGRPIANVRLQILDDRSEPVGPGERGELCIGGMGVGSGYLKRPELTASRFIPDRFSDDAQARLYRTGDLCSFREDGAVEFLGRLDDQVKVRGFRIEPGEIDAAVQQHPSVKSCLTIAREDQPGNLRLVTYLVAKDDGEPQDSEELRAFVAARLPAHMVPAAFVRLREWPLGSSGKIDRKALPAPVFSAAPDDAGRPRSPLESRLAAIWRDVLGIGPFGVHATFIELGGHSLMANRLAAHVEQEWGVPVSTRVLYQHCTVARMAQWLAANATTPAPRAPEGRETAEPADNAGPDGLLPLSFCQRRMWFIEQLEPGTTQFNEPVTYVLKGLLDPQALASALDALIARHEILRTRLVEKDGQAFRQVLPEYAIHLACEDFSADESDRIQRLIDEAVELDDRTPFDLEAGPPFRARLVRTARDTHYLLWNCHHILTDGWSQLIFNRELGALYAACRAGRHPALPPLPAGYSDHVLRQQAFMQSAAAARDLAYWTEKLRDAPAPVSLKVDYPEGLVQSRRSGTIIRELDDSLQAALSALAQNEGVTQFMLLLACTKVLLARLSGQDDLIVGIPVTGRLTPESESIMGAFIETLPVRTDLSGNPPFKACLGRVRDSVIEAFDHQRLPFEKIVEELHSERDLKRPPLFQVLFNMYSMLPESQLALPDVAVQEIERTAHDAKFDLTLYVNQSAGKLRVVAVYKAARFSSESVDRTLDQLFGIFRQVARDPMQPILRYTLVTESTRRLLPDPARPIAVHTPVPVTRQFSERARSAPGKPAVVHDDQVWSYADLDACSIGVGSALRQAGLQAGQTVVVTGPRCYGMIAALLGVLRAGGVLCPLDATLPPARRRLLLERSQAVFLVAVEDAARGGIDQASGLGGLPTLGLDAQGRITTRPQAGDAGTAKELPDPDPQSAAYIFFTSGTTGVPKAVLGNHKGLSHFIDWERTLLSAGPDDRVAQLTGLSFDVVLRDLFLPLTSGATLCLPDAGLSTGSHETLEWIARQRITILHTVPSLAGAWLAGTDKPVANPRLRAVLFAGEPLHHGLVDRWRRQASPDARIFNLYGPTETTLAKSCFEVPAPPLDGVQPVGRPLPGAQLLVLNPDSRLCGIREPGEIFIRTPYRTNGYMDAAPADAARFSQSPFSGDPDDILYRTGDRGAYDVDGKVLIGGRLDDQVKIRGIRIEPLEVAAHLNRHPAVRQSVVTAHADGPDEVRLVGYFTCKDGAAVPSDVDLRRHLREIVPDYMVPAAFMHLDRLPLTPNGKVNRRALPPPPSTRAAAGPSYAAPRGELETAVASIWSELLGIKRIGANDNFFELGGHSFLAARMVAMLRQVTGQQLPVAVLFEAPTVAQLARRLAGSRAEGPARSLVPLQPKGRLRPLFCLHGWGGDVYIFLDLARALNPNRPVYGLQAVGLDGSVPRHSSVEQMAQHYAWEIRTMQPEGPYNLLGYSAGGWIAYAVAQVLAGQGQSVRLHVLDTVMSSTIPYPLYALTRTIQLCHRLPHHVLHWLRTPLSEKLGYMWSSWQWFLVNVRRTGAPPQARETPQRQDQPPPGRDYYAWLASRYKPPRYPGDLVLFAASDTPGYMRLFWRYLIRGRLEVVRAAGGHLGIINRQNVADLSRQLEESLRRVD